MYPRPVRSRVVEALRDTPAVLVHGPRRAGKSTLVREFADDVLNVRYVTLDDAAPRAAAVADPEGFLAALGPRAAIDEVQRCPGLLLALKAAIDRAPDPGRYLLTGSADVLAVPRVAESLAGRVEIVSLRPLTQREIARRSGSAVDAWFAARPPRAPARTVDRDDVAARIVRGGFPEAVARPAAERREAWFDAYLTTVLERDVRDLGRVADLDVLPRLMTLCAARTAGVVNLADLARDAGLAHTTLGRYLTLLRTAFLVHLLPARHVNASKRLVKAAKLLLLDAGLAARLLRVTADRIWDDPAAGRLLETFVVGEVLAQAAWSDARPTASHFRVHGGREVDLVLEDRAGRIVGVEVRATGGVDAHDFAGLKTLADLAGRRFVRGIVLHLGREDVPFAPDLHAVPIPSLWDGRS